MMRLLLAALLSLALASQAGAACFVEYKAKRDNPLRLHYGIVQLDDRSCRNPGPAVARRIAAGGWQLLTVMGVLNRNEAERRQRDAGAYYLRY